MAANDPLDTDVFGDGITDHAPEGDSFDADLSEFEAAVPKPVEPEPGPRSATSKELAAYIEQAEAEGFDRKTALQFASEEIRSKADLDAAHEGYLTNYTKSLMHLKEVAQQVSIERDRLDAIRIYETLRREFPSTPEARIKEKLDAKYYTDERTRSAWLGRYRDPASWTREFNRIGQELHAEQASAVDPDATATRAAVTWAVQGGARSAPREQAMPNLNQLSDAELDRFTRENFGFGTGLI